jgi:tripartite-type tricarboxylate transporter receptor subunit TctC
MNAMKRTILYVLLAAVLLFAQLPIHAQTYPSKPIRWIVPSAAGGTGFDGATRALTPVLAARLGQPIVIENHPGSSGIVGMERGARAAPDGYLLLTAGTSQLIFSKFFYAKLPYDPQKDFAPISTLVDLPIALWAHTSVPAKNLPELVAYAKANPGKLNYGSAGVGHIFHLAMEMLARRTGIEVVHIPTKGVAPSQVELNAGRIQLLFGVASSQVLAQMREGRLRAIVAANERRLPQLPDVPTLAESGVADMDVPNWIGWVAPAGLPAEILQRLHREMLAAIVHPDVTKAYDSQSMVRMTSTPEEFARKIDRELAAWGPIIRKLKITLD